MADHDHLLFAPYFPGVTDKTKIIYVPIEVDGYGNPRIVRVHVSQETTATPFVLQKAGVPFETEVFEIKKIFIGADVYFADYSSKTDILVIGKVR
jgi:hypothetical protein